MSSKRKASSSGGAAPLNVNLGPASTEQAGQAGGASSTAKRTRFEDAQPDDDTDLAGDLDLQEQERKRTQQGRRGRVVTAGYDSEEDDSGEDSENEDEEGHETARKSQRERGGKAKVAGIDEDDDMFDLEKGSDDEKEKGDAKSGSNKRYLQLGEIEGQEFGEEKDEEKDRDLELEIESDDEENDEEDEDDNDEDINNEENGLSGVKKQKKNKVGYDPEDMGGKLDSFNMKAEMAAGRFDEEGNYIANAKDPHADHDQWLTGNYSRKGIKAAKEAQAKRERQRREEEAQRDAKALDEDESKKRLVECMCGGETVLEALQRLGAASKREAKASSSAKKTAGSLSQGKSKADSEGNASKAMLEEVTSLASDLMARYGLVNIYDETYESLLRDVRRSGLVRETWDPARVATNVQEGSTAPAQESEQDQGQKQQDTRLFEYRWSPAYLSITSQAPDPDIKTFGPFGVKDLLAWKGSGFFGNDGERILLRVTDGDRQWRKWSDVFSS